ncbi:MAG: DUF2490 domain-containing protein [Flavobacteriales bacterium]|jgi:hypothetical protein
MRHFITALLCFSILSVFSQNKDFGIWTSGNFTYKPSKKLDFSVLPEFRWDQNVTRFRTRLIDFRGRYDITDEWTGILVYRFAGTQRNSGWQPRRRFQLGISYKFKYDEFTFSITSRVQRGRRLETATRDADLNNSWRNKLEATYKGLKKLGLSISYEFFHSLMEVNRLDWTDWRWVLEGEYKLGGGHYVSMGYLVQNEFRTGPDNRDRILLFGYKYVLKKKNK